MLISISYGQRTPHCRPPGDDGLGLCMSIDCLLVTTHLFNLCSS
jgi:hypothetical protein